MLFEANQQSAMKNPRTYKSVEQKITGGEELSGSRFATVKKRRPTPMKMKGNAGSVLLGSKMYLMSSVS